MLQYVYTVAYIVYIAYGIFNSLYYIETQGLEHFKGGNTTCGDYDECTNGIYYYSEHNPNQLNNNFDSWPPQVKLPQSIKEILFHCRLF